MEQFINEFVSGAYAVMVNSLPERAGICVIAILASLFFGLFFGAVKGRAVPYYWVLLEKIFGRYAAKSFKPDRSRSSLSFRGGLLTLFVIALSLIIGSFFSWLNRFFPAYRIPELLAVYICISTGVQIYILEIIRKNLNDPGLSQTRVFYSLAVTTRYDLNKMDNHSIARNAASFSVILFERALILPVIFYLIFGFLGLFLSSGVAAVMWFAGREGHGGGFQALSAGILRLMSLFSIPVSATLLFISTFFTPRVSIISAIRGCFARKSPDYFEGGILLNIVSYAANLVFGGTVKDVTGIAIKRDWAGPDKATAKIDINSLRSIQYLLFTSFLLFVFALLAFIVLQG